ncbi:SMP-30/gluconolactonase/LRE family protein [Maribacter sp. 2308TA10-17]|uniref:SMP-30/gluconolactonase/LRE family protein n=1 Tax=Maribacter sp. 2308TA10-17 TaxID=3386276 RepID=UPI0039BCC6FC
MKRLKKIIGYSLLLILVYVGYVMVSTGYFRAIENTFDGEVIKEIPVEGAEDIIVIPEWGYALVSASPRKKDLEVQQKTGGLYLVDLNSKEYKLKMLTTDLNTPFAPHGISIYKTDSTYKVMTINHTLEGHSFEVFKLRDSVLTFERTITNPALVSPNDVVMLDENRFYFTNDHKYEDGVGMLLEDYGGLGLSNVMYFDGETYTEVAKGIGYANGINYDAKRKLLFVAEPRNFKVKVYATNEDGSLNFIEDIDCGTGVDNIEFDSYGNLWIGAHPNLLAFSSYAGGGNEIAPSEIIKIAYRGKGDYTIEMVYLNDGTEMSASTVAAPYKDIILTGNVMDDHFLILKPNE